MKNFNKARLNPLTNAFKLCVVLFFFVNNHAISQPLFDNCSNAINITVQSSWTYTQYNSTNATVSTIPDPECSSGTIKDVWMKFTVPANGNFAIMFDTTASSSSMKDGVMALYSGSCASLSFIACDDNGNPANKMPAYVGTGYSAGSIIYIRFWGKSGTTGSFLVCVKSYTPLSYDNCLTPKNLTVSNNCSFSTYSTLGANISDVALPSCNNSSTLNDVWFKAVVPASGNLTVTTMPGTMINAGMAWYYGSCGSFTFIDCDDNSSQYPGMPRLMLNNLQPGADIWIRVWDNSDYSIGGTFGLCIYEGIGQECNDNNPVPDDLCSSAPYIFNLDGFCGFTFSAPTYNVDNHAFTTNGNCGFSIENNSWLKFISSSPNVSLSVWVYECNTDNGIQIGVFKGNCNSGFTNVACSQRTTEPKTTTGNDTMINFNINGLVVGETYYIMIDGYAGDVCGYTVKANYGVLTVSAGNDTTICSGTTLVRQARGVPGLSYEWYSDAACTNLISAGQTLTVAPGIAQSPITYYLKGHSDPPALLMSVIDSFTVVVNQSMGAASFTSGAASVCQNSNDEQYIVNAPNATSVSYSISPASAGSINQQNGIVNWNPTFNGVATVTGIAMGCGGSQSVSKQVQVSELPVVNLGPNASICNGGSVILDAGNPGCTFQWSTGSSNQSITVNAAGTYSVTVTNSTGCIAFDEILISVQPYLQLNLGNDTTICQGQTLQLNAGNPGASYAWSNGTHNQILSVSNSGAYSVTVTNTSGCVNSDQINISVSQLPSVSLGSDTLICSGSSIALNAYSQGSSYLWSTGDTLQSINAFTTGLYSVTVTNAFGCQANDNINVTISQPVLVELGNDTTICSGSIITLNAGNAGAQYSWNNNVHTQQISISTPGVYSVTVTNSNGCKGTDQIAISVSTNPVVMLGNDTVICENTQLTIHAANFGCSYLWNNGNTTESITVSNSGIYSVTVINAFGCRTNDNINISIHEIPEASVSPAISTSICNGSSVVLSASGGTEYEWSNGENTESITVAPQNTTRYFVTVSDYCGSDTVSTLVTVNAAVASIIATIDSVCSGNSTLLTAGGASSYIWSTGETSQTIAITPGNTTDYFVTVTGNGCKDSTSIHIVVKPNVVATVSPSTICFGQQASLTVGGGITYFWSTSETTQQITVSPQSTTSYFVTVSKNGCSDTAEVPVIVNPVPIVNIGSDSTLCTGTSLVLNAGNTGAAYTWGPGGELTQAISVNSTGNYFVTVTNSFGCKSIDNAEIIFNSSPNVNLGSDTSVCSNQPYHLNAGNYGSNYEWNNGAVSQIVNVLNSGLYKVTVTNSFDCSKSDSVYVIVNNAPAINLGNDTVLCKNENIILNAGSGAMSYSWNVPSTGQHLNIIESGVYMVTVTSFENCINSDTISVVFNPKPILNLGNDTSICNGSQLFLNSGNTGASYQWSDGAINQYYTVSIQGTYSVTVTNLYNCSIADSINVDVNPVPSLNLGNDTSFCTGTTYLLNPGISNVAFTWSDNSHNSDLLVTSSGTYSLTVTNIFNCRDRDTVNIIMRQIPVVNLGMDTSICIGNTILLNAFNSGSAFSWNTGSTSQTILVNSTGNYRVIVTNQENCSAVDSVSVVVNNLPLVDLGSDTSICNGFSIFLNAGNAGSNFLWNDNSYNQSLIVNTPGTYSVIVTDYNGCSESDNINIALINVPSMPFVRTPDVYCVGDTAELLFAIGADLKWYNMPLSGTQYPSTPLPQTFLPSVVSYFVSQTVSGCESPRAQVDVVVNPIPSPPTVLTPVNFCLNDSSEQLLATGSSLLWYLSQNGGLPEEIAPYPETGVAGTTNYYVSQTVNGCESSRSQSAVNVFSLPIAFAGNDTAICKNDSLMLNASGGNSYAWSTGTSNGAYHKPLNSQIIYVTVTDSHMCRNTDSISVSIVPLPSVSLPPDTSVCSNAGITIKGLVSNCSALLWQTSGSGTFLYHNDSVTVFQASSADYLHRNVYIYFTGTSICGTGKDSLKLNFFTLPNVYAGKDSSIIKGDDIELMATGASNYTWHSEVEVLCNNCQSFIVTPEQSEVFYVNGTDQNLCSVTDTIIVTVKDLHNVFIPSGFSPNSDNNNDRLFVRGNGVKSISFMIYNRWGQKVFETSNINEGWDGTFNGEKLNPGVFVYFLVAEFNNGESLRKKGDVTLVR